MLVSNLRPGILARLGLEPAELTERFPCLIVCEISGFGVTGGPYARRPAFDSVIQAMSGLSSLIGAAPEAPPGLAPMATMDLLSGLYAAVGILAALAGRARTGRGCQDCGQQPTVPTADVDDRGVGAEVVASDHRRVRHL